MNSPKLGNLLNNSSLAIFVCLFADLAENIRKIKLKNCITFPCDSVLLCFLCLSLASLWTRFCESGLPADYTSISWWHTVMCCLDTDIWEHRSTIYTWFCYWENQGNLEFSFGNHDYKLEKKSIKSFRRRKICKP